MLFTSCGILQHIATIQQLFTQVNRAILNKECFYIVMANRGDGVEGRKVIAGEARKWTRARYPFDRPGIGRRQFESLLSH